MAHHYGKFQKAMETKFAKEWGFNKNTADFDIQDRTTKYLRLGIEQNPRKVEMAKCGAATTKKRGPSKPSDTTDSFAPDSRTMTVPPASSPGVGHGRIHSIKKRDEIIINGKNSL